MVRLRLSTKFLLSMLLISAGLTITSLLLVRRTLQSEVSREIRADLRNSVLNFLNVQRQRQILLSRSAQLMADLPNLRAVMTASDALTIQDASTAIWHLGGSDLFVLADRSGKIVALHTSTPGFTCNMAQQLFGEAVAADTATHWWFGGGHLYEVFLEPIFSGPPSENRPLGSLVVGYEITDQVAQEASLVSGSRVAFWYGTSLAKGTLSGVQQSQMLEELAGRNRFREDPAEIQLGTERFLTTSVELAPGANPPVRLSVLKSFDQATSFLKQLNRLLLGLGLVAVLGGSVLVFGISHTFTRPLATLVSGVRALEKGDYSYPLEARSGDEVAEVTSAFSRMRATLEKTHRELLEAERLATIGRMASSISHDLRHSLAAVVANAEFLAEGKLDARQREDLYLEVRIAVDHMTEMLESFLEFSRTSESLRPSYGRVQESLDRAIQTIRAHPDFSHASITVNRHGACEGWFDFQRLERAFQNLLLNAVEAMRGENGRVEVDLHEVNGAVEVRVADNGPGIPAEVRGKLFQPFVSSGKQNGTGLGLTVVQKIVQDHGGEINVLETSQAGTVFRVVLPLVRKYGSPGAPGESVKPMAPATGN